MIPDRYQLRTATSLGGYSNKRAFKEKFIVGGSWIAASQGVVQVLQFFATALLAHLLSPGDFGLIALCFIVTGTITVFREIGLPQAIIQRRELTSGHINAAFWSLSVMALLSAATIFAGADALAKLLGNNRVDTLLAVMAGGFLLSSPGLIPAAVLSRRMNFKRLGVCDIGSVVGNAAVALPLALAGYGVWALAFGFLAGDAARTFLAFYLSGWRPGFRFTGDELRGLFGFGAGITASSLAFSFRNYFDKFLVGRFLGVGALGGYALAFRIVTAPQQRISWLVSRVTFAGFSSIQDDDEKIGRVYCKTLKLVALISVPALTGLIICARDFVALIYGSQWLFMVSPLRIMCGAGIFYAVGTTVGPVMLAKGQAALVVKWSFMMTALLTGAVLIGVGYGLTGVAIGLTVQAAVGYGLGFVLLIRLIKMKFAALLTVFRVPLAAAALVSASASVTRAVLAGHGVTLRLFATVIIASLVYFTYLWFSRVPELMELKSYAVRKLTSGRLALRRRSYEASGR